jgi:hypothetical protein
MQSQTRSSRFSRCAQSDVWVLAGQPDDGGPWSRAILQRTRMWAARCSEVRGRGSRDQRGMRDWTHECVQMRQRDSLESGSPSLEKEPIQPMKRVRIRWKRPANVQKRTSLY